MIQQYHDNFMQNYSGIFKITELFSQNYYFPEIKKIEYYISKYSNYQYNKYNIYIPYRYIQFAKIIKYFWQEITINFIIKLLKSENYITGVLYNSILIVINKLTKYLYLILYKETNNAK